MTAVISAIMIGFGFLNGLAVASLLERGYTSKIQTMLTTAMEKKFELEKQVRTISDALEEERMSKEKLLESLKTVLRKYTYDPNQFYSDDDDVEITSQDMNPNNKD